MLTLSLQGTLIRIFSTSNCTKIAELRRGVDHAVIYSLGISPSNDLLAVTSDKSTLHIFDLPHPRTMMRRSQSPTSQSEDMTNQKWGLLGRIPLLPRVFSDIYSFASVPFEIGDESLPSRSYLPPIGIGFGRPQKGVVGWSNNQTIIVLGAGKDGRWQRFVIYEEDGKRQCVRDGWKGIKR